MKKIKTLEEEVNLIIIEITHMKDRIIELEKETMIKREHTRIKNGIKKGKIKTKRYKSYIDFLNGISEKKK